MPTTPTYLWYVEAAVDGMCDIVAELGDDVANRRPALPGANAPYAILTHCLGVMEYWGGYAVAGRTIVRDRAAEFVASGTVADLVARAGAAKAKLAADLAGLVEDAPPPPDVRADPDLKPHGRTQAGVVLHIIEELAQHRGQMEITRDVLLAAEG